MSHMGWIQLTKLDVDFQSTAQDVLTELRHPDHTFYKHEVCLSCSVDEMMFLELTSYLNNNTGQDAHSFRGPGHHWSLLREDYFYL